MNRFGLRSWEVDALIAWMLHYMRPGTRARLMRDLPQVYNAICEGSFVRVVRESDGRTVAIDDEEAERQDGARKDIP